MPSVVPVSCVTSRRSLPLNGPEVGRPGAPSRRECPPTRWFSAPLPSPVLVPATTRALLAERGGLSQGPLRVPSAGAGRTRVPPGAPGGSPRESRRRCPARTRRRRRSGRFPPFPTQPSPVDELAGVAYQPAAAGFAWCRGSHALGDHRAPRHRTCPDAAVPAHLRRPRSLVGVRAHRTADNPWGPRTVRPDGRTPVRVYRAGRRSSPAGRFPVRPSNRRRIPRPPLMCPWSVPWGEHVDRRFRGGNLALQALHRRVSGRRALRPGSWLVLW